MWEPTDSPEPYGPDPRTSPLRITVEGSGLLRPRFYLPTRRLVGRVGFLGALEDGALPLVAFLAVRLRARASLVAFSAVCLRAGVFFAVAFVAVRLRAGAFPVMRLAADFPAGDFFAVVLPAIFLTTMAEPPFTRGHTGGGRRKSASTCDVTGGIAKLRHWPQDAPARP